MTPDEYQRSCARTEANQDEARQRIVRGMVPIRLNHAVVGMVAEVGELADVLKKHVFYGQELDKAAVVEEIGDLLWHVSLACNAIQVKLEDVMKANIAKLVIRFPKGFSEVDFKHRDRCAERAALTKHVEGEDA